MKPPFDITCAPPEAILEWARMQAWWLAMTECGQDATWHAEGDVGRHTEMVCREVVALPEWQTLLPVDRFVLFCACLLHDSGKPATTRVDPGTGHTISPKHSFAGEKLSRRILRDLGVPYTLREMVCALVRYHGHPPFLLKSPDEARDVIRASWRLSNRLLYLLAIADFRGRDARDGNRSEDLLDLWKMVAEENDCLDQAFRFANDHARFLFFRDELSDRFYTPHESYRCRATLVCGLPGAGKDTWIARHRADEQIVSLDQVRADLDVEPTDEQGVVIQEAREQVRVCLRAKSDFCLNATNITRDRRKRWIDLCAEYGARVEIVYVEPPLPTILAQNRGREKAVPERVIQHLSDLLEPPTITEAHALRVVAEGTR